jgi:hypothetical protein
MSKYKKVKRLFSFNNLKILKSQKFGYEGVILHLAPFDLSGWNVCPLASKGCIKGCLNTSGLGQLNVVQKARINKTHYLRFDRQKFLDQLDREIANGIIRAKKKNKILCVRLNGTSDLSFEKFKVRDNKTLFELYPQINFYDYTKNYLRFKNKLPKNYHLTFSLSEENLDIAKDIIKNTKTNIAVVFRKKLPKKFLGRKVIDGDINDLRFLDKPNSIVGLIAKGKARHDNSGFVYD